MRKLICFWSVKFLSIYLIFCLVNCTSPSPSSSADASPSPPREAAAMSLSGTPLYAPPPQPKQLENLRLAAQRFQEDSTQEDAIIWLGRRTAYLSRYKEAIEIYTRGLALYPDSYRLYRHRGHRYISTRQFDLALADFKQAAALAPDTIEIEPDGIPNKLNQPLSNTAFNIWYHMGLAHYLQGGYTEAIKAYQQCMKYSVNDDLICATTDWLYMSLRKAGKEAEAAQVLQDIHADMEIVENDSYHKRLMMYKGLISPEEVLKVDEHAADRALSLATQGYGVGNYYLLEGETDRARKVFQEVVGGKHWSAFGFIAAEAELLRMQ